MPYIPGENWCICDLSGKKVLMSQTRKTWDGLRVWAPLWYPKHPQLSVRGIPERMTVRDSRPRPADVSQFPAYGAGPIYLQSPDGTTFVLQISNIGTVSTAITGYMPEPTSYYINSYTPSVDNSGVVTLTGSTLPGPNAWLMVSPNEVVWSVTVTSGSFVTTVIG